MAVVAWTTTSRQPFAEGRAFGQVGPYERVDGTAHLAVSPDHARNAGITDLGLAPRDASGLVHFSTDVCVLRPASPERGSRRLLLDVLNRGTKVALRLLNCAVPAPSPNEPLDPGDGFLMRHGFTVAWCGWQHDVPDVDGLMRVRVPEAYEGGRPITGPVMATIQTDAHTQARRLPDPYHTPLPAADLFEADARLLVRDHAQAPAVLLPRESWQFGREEDGQVVPDANHVFLAEGFSPGRVYQLVYTTIGAPVAGLGSWPPAMWCRSCATRLAQRATPVRTTSGRRTGLELLRAAGSCARFSI